MNSINKDKPCIVINDRCVPSLLLQYELNLLNEGHFVVKILIHVQSDSNVFFRPQWISKELVVDQNFYLKIDFSR